MKCFIEEFESLLYMCMILYWECLVVICIPIEYRGQSNKSEERSAHKKRGRLFGSGNPPSKSEGSANTGYRSLSVEFLVDSNTTIKHSMRVHT